MINKEILRNLKKECYFCGGDDPENLEIHHKIPKDRGGLDLFENLVYLCTNCHKEFHSVFICGRTPGQAYRNPTDKLFLERLKKMRKKYEHIRNKKRHHKKELFKNLGDREIP
jgi:5-methylcytosine-specific restriction endonuclease McrA